MSKVFGKCDSFAIGVRPVALPADAATSAEAASLSAITLWCAGTNLCRGHDEDGRIEELEVPLIDLAHWLVTAWEDLVYGVDLPGALADRFKSSVPMAERWQLHSALALGVDEEEVVFRWARSRAIEFAATDYLLPNVVFDRVDDFIRVSWSQRSTSPAFCELKFDPSAGTLLLDVGEFVAAMRAMLGEVSERLRDIDDDARVDDLRAFLREVPEEAGRRVVQRWIPAADASAILAPTELAQLGRTGRGEHTAAFLRSSSQVLPLSAVRRCLSVLGKVRSQLRGDVANRLREGAPTDIDPAAPWESGLALARHVRERFSTLGTCGPDESVPIDEVLADLGVEVRELDFGTPDVDGVCLMDRDRHAVAIVNEGGTLASTRVGRRSTLAHELCHFLFDAARFEALGQVDVRRVPDSMLEKRANAFAAELLLPRQVLVRASESYRMSREALEPIARRLGVGMQLARHQAENAGIVID